MRLASVCKQRDPCVPDESGEERSAVDAAYSKWARPGGAFDEEGWIAYKSSLCPPVSDVDFVRNGGAELVLDEYAFNGVGGFEVVDERSRESGRDYGCDMQVSHDEAIIEMMGSDVGDDISVGGSVAPVG